MQQWAMARTHGGLAHVPGGDGWPLVGHSVRFLRDAHGLMDEHRERYGDVFRVRVAGRPSVVFLTPQATREIYLDPGRALSSEGGWASSIGVLFRRGLMLRDFEDHHAHRRVMQQAFSRTAMAGYVGTVHAVVRRELGGLPDGPVDMYQLMKRLTLAIAAEVFVGDPLGQRTERVNRAFVAAVRASITPLRADLPGTVYGRGIRGRRELERYFGGLVAERRRAGPRPDLLTRLSQATTESGESLPADEVVDHMIFLMLAAHDTTTSALAVLLWQLARHPEQQQRVAEFGDRPVGLSNHGDLPVLGRALQEAMRLAPPVPFSPRVATRDVVIDGVPLPAGTAVGAASMTLHRHPRWWTEPDAFDPDRFAPERAEHKQHSHLYVPFGGGAHLCIGNHFAEVVVKAVVVRLLGPRAPGLGAAGAPGAPGGGASAVSASAVRAPGRRVLSVAPGRPVLIAPVPIPRPRHGMVLTVR
jgi:cytochrome P450